MKRKLAACVAALALAAGGAIAASGHARAATCSFSWPTPDPYNATCTYSYSGSPYFTGMPSSASAPNVSQNVWSQDTGYSQSMTSTDPGHWTVTANTNALGSSNGIDAFPNTGWGMAWPEQPVDGYPDIESSWSVTLPAAGARVAGWSAYDLWFNNWADEVMIQTDITAPQPAYACPAIYAQATIDGLPWYLCVFGSERVWKPGTSDSDIQSIPAGQLNITPFIQYLESHPGMTGAMKAGSTWTAGGFGFEVADTGGASETFTVSGFTWNMSGTSGGQQAPAVVTSAATSVTSSGATLNGTVNPEGADASYQFDYGTTSSYGSSTTAADAGSGTTAVSESAALTGLAAGTTYHYRIEATSSAGTTLGGDQSFTTSSVAAPGGLSQTPHEYVNFGWQAVSGWSGSYEFQLQANNGTVVDDQTVSALNVQDVTVSADTAYKWRVRASGGTWSALRSFTSP